MMKAIQGDALSMEFASLVKKAQSTEPNDKK